MTWLTMSDQRYLEPARKGAYDRLAHVGVVQVLVQGAANTHKIRVVGQIHLPSDREQERVAGDDGDLGLHLARRVVVD